MQKSPGNKHKQHIIIIILKLIASKINIPNFMALYMFVE